MKEGNHLDITHSIWRRLSDTIVPANKAELGKLHELQDKLSEFYNKTQTYAAFQTPSDQSQWHWLFVPELMSLLARKEKVRILEIGAGLTSYPQIAERMLAVYRWILGHGEKPCDVVLA